MTWPRDIGAASFVQVKFTGLSLTGVLRRPLVQNKLLDDAENHTAADADRCASENKSRAAVLARIVGICERPEAKSPKMFE